MANPETEWNRWIDGVPGEDGEAGDDSCDFAGDPVVLQEKAFHQRLAGDLRAALPAVQEPPYPDFFNEQIRRRLEREFVAEEGAPSLAQTFWERWFPVRRLIPIGAFLVLALAAVQTVLLPPPHTTATEVVHTYTPQPSLRIRSDYSPEANATVLRIEGAESLPDDYDFAAVQPEDAGAVAAAAALQRLSRPPVFPVFFIGGRDSSAR